MDRSLSRRLLLKTAAGMSAAAATPALARKPMQEAFPPEAMFVSDPEHSLLGPDKGVALLERNENPYGPSKSALKMIEYAAKKGAYYPERAGGILASMIAERNGVDKSQVAITTGSAEALSAIAVMRGPMGPIVAPRLFFDATVLYAERLGLATIQRAPLLDNLDIDLAAIEALVTDETGFVQLCNPNNPTGRMLNSKALKKSVKRMAKKTLVVVDEAYVELTDNPEKNSCVDLIRDGHNVVVSRTFSKLYGMAGIRVGYTISSPEVAKSIRQTAMSWIAGTGLAAAIGSYNDESFIEYSKAKIFEGRDMIADKVTSLGMEALPSQTNFIYFKSGKPANEVKDSLREKNIWVRGQYMDYADWTRVSTGRLEDVERFCNALPEVV